MPDAEYIHNVHLDPHRLELRGREQHEIAARALHSVGLHEPAGYLDDSLERLDRFVMVNDQTGIITNYNNIYADVGPIYRDITFGLITMGQRPNASEDDKLDSHELLKEIQRQQNVKK